jgi:hypothetical protein
MIAGRRTGGVIAGGQDAPGDRLRARPPCGSLGAARLDRLGMRLARVIARAGWVIATISVCAPKTIFGAKKRSPGPQKAAERSLRTDHFVRLSVWNCVHLKKKHDRHSPTLDMSARMHTMRLTPRATQRDASKGDPAEGECPKPLVL